LFKKIERPTHIYQDVANQIEDAILSEKLKIGDRLPAERELAETFEISRRTLRESLRVVEQKGLIEIKSTGAYVRMATSEKLSQSLGLAIRSKQIAWKDITLFRTEMEGNIVMKAAKTATRKDIEALVKIVKDAEALLAGDELNWIAYLLLDKKMHLTLA
jgi:DNA-binding FadR family transcriptional regulator